MPTWSLALIAVFALPVQSLAVDISLAALLGDKVYSFGELLLHPIVSIPSLALSQSWLHLSSPIFEPPTHGKARCIGLWIMDIYMPAMPGCISMVHVTSPECAAV